MTTKPMKFVFNDTMIYLHFSPVDQIDWLDLLNRKRVQIILPRITLRELDRHKSAHPSAKIRDRARRTLKMLETKITSNDPSLRKGVELEQQDMLPSLNYASIGLNPEWPDDVLLASVVCFMQENPGLDVVLVTDDTGARIKARSLGIKTLELPDELRLPSAPDPLVEQNRKLRERLAKIAGAMAALELQFSNDERYVRLTYSPTSAESPENRSARIASKLEGVANQYQLSPIISASSFITSKGEIERYNRDLKEYLEKYEKYLNDMADWQTQRDMTFTLNLEVVNDGGAPAEDIDILMFFSEDFLILQEDDLRPEPTPPAEPTPPRTAIELMQSSLDFTKHFSGYSFDPSQLARLSDLSREPPNVSGPTIRRTKSYEIEYHIRRLKHGFSVRLDPLFLDYSEFEEVKSFHFSHWISAANMPEQVEGRLHVIFEPEGQNNK